MDLARLQAAVNSSSQLVTVAGFGERLSATFSFSSAADVSVLLLIRIIIANLITALANPLPAPALPCSPSVPLCSSLSVDRTMGAMPLNGFDQLVLFFLPFALCSSSLRL